MAEKGFTLIELIAVLVLAGIIAAFAGAGLVTVVDGYLFTKLNAATAQKGQVALARLVKEFTVISAAPTVGPPFQYTAVKNGAAGAHQVFLNGSALYLDGDILADNVSALTLSYTPASQVIDITLTLAGAENIATVLTSRVVPRNM